MNIIIIHTFNSTMVALLTGYAFFAKGFAYLHLPVGVPIYVGEIVLIIGLIMAINSPRIILMTLRNNAIRIYLMFIMVGIMCTAPFVNEYGINAIRDAAMYYYGLYMIIVAAAVIYLRKYERIANGYSKIASIYFIWAPIALGWTYFLGNILPMPNVPGAEEIRFIFLRPGDVMVHSTGAFIFWWMLPNRGYYFQKHKYLAIIIYVITFILTSASRAAILIGLTGIIIATITKPLKYICWLALIVFALVVLIGLFNVESAQLGGRKIGVDGIKEGIESLFNSDMTIPDSYLGTKTQRLIWWKYAIDQVFWGPYPLGRGFGDNLIMEVDKNSWIDEQNSNRNPHNIFITILWRMGLPGLLLWVMLNIAVFANYRCLKKIARKSGDTMLNGITMCLMAYWMMFLIYSSCSVVLEGPFGGIWFWSILGYSVALRELKVREISRLQTA